jgi:hypothetical protein
VGGFASAALKVRGSASDSAIMHPTYPQVTGADAQWAARLRGFDPFLDDLAQAQLIDDAQDIRELMKVAAVERSVAITFPSMPEIFHGTIMTRPGARNSGPPLVLVDVSAAGLDTTTWTKGIPVNFGSSTPEYVGCRTSFAGSVGQIMALIGPRVLYRVAPTGRERRAVPRDTAVIARFALQGEGQRMCWLREVGRASIRGSIEAGPLHRAGLRLPLSITLPDGARPACRRHARADAPPRGSDPRSGARRRDRRARTRRPPRGLRPGAPIREPTPPPQTWSTP